jgi:hypothetical protein
MKPRITYENEIKAIQEQTLQSEANKQFLLTKVLINVLLDIRDVLPDIKP